jgi:hypothetical protein
VLNTKNQLGVRGTCQRERKIKAQVEKHLGRPLMVELVQGFLSYWI